MPALTCAVALVQYREDGLGRVHAREHVDRGDAELQRPLAFLAVGGHEPALALHDQVVAWPVTFVAEHRVAGNGAVDQTGVVPAQVVIAQPHLLRAAVLEVLDDDVRARREVARELDARGVLQIDAD